jgi:hypothetical protein
MLLWTGISRVRVHAMDRSGAAHRVIGDSGGTSSRLPGVTLLKNWPDPHADHRDFTHRWMTHSAVMEHNENSPGFSGGQGSALWAMI